jgi:hypothetical protein
MKTKNRSISSLFYLCAALCLLAIPPIQAEENSATDNSESRALRPVNKTLNEHRVALVIGNSSYSNSPLKNPVNDAMDVAKKLRGLGFEVIERTNFKARQIGAMLREFRSKLTPGAVAVVFYAGHGLQIKGENYLPAVDAEIESEEDAPNQSLAVRQVMDVLDESKTRLNLVFLDACRNNPYARSFRSAGSGLARVSAPSGTLISYATRPGSVAADGNGRNGLYTSQLLVQMDGNLQIEQSLKRIVSQVKAASQGKQEPWMEGSIEGDFCFSGCGNDDAPQMANLSLPVVRPKPMVIPTPNIPHKVEPVIEAAPMPQVAKLTVEVVRPKPAATSPAAVAHQAEPAIETTTPPQKNLVDIPSF